MPREALFTQELVYYLSAIRNDWRTNPVVLGGSTGSGGGVGGNPGGFVGQLPQRQVAGDTTESFSYTDSITSLLDNLNRMRAWEKPAKNFWADTIEEPRLYISDGVWYFEDGQPPVVFSGGSTPAISPPTSGSRYDLLTLNSQLEFSWISSAEGNPPASLPAFPEAVSNQIPLWMVLSRSSGSVIKRYDDGVSHYIFGDYRPFIGAPTYVPTSGSSYMAYRWHVDGALSSGSMLDGVYYIPDTYDLVGASMWVNVPPTSGSVIADIQYSNNYGATWTSVFVSLPTLTSGSHVLQSTDDLSLPGGSLVKADIVDPGVGAEGLSLTLFGTIRAASGGGTVTSVSANASDGIVASVVNPTTTPVINLSLGDITPDSVTSTGSLIGANLTGINTGDQTISLTGAVSGTGTSTIATTLSNTGVTPGVYTNSNITVGADGRITYATSGSFGGIYQFPPEDVGSVASQGTSEFAAPGDHVHRGVSSVSTSGGTLAYGDIVLVPGTNVSIAQSSGSFTFSMSGGVAGVSSVSTPGGTLATGDIVLIPGDNITISQSSGSITFNATSGSIDFASTEESRAGVLTDKAVPPAGLPLRVVDGALIFNQPYGGDARGPGSVDLQTARVYSDSVSSGSYSGIFAGYDNQVYGHYATAVGGQGNVAAGEGSAALGGQNNDSAGNFSVSLGGYENSTNGAYSAVLGGRGCEARTDYSVAIGDSAVAQNFGEVAASSGPFSNNLNAGCQSTLYVGFRGEINHTGNTGFIDLYIDGASESYSMNVWRGAPYDAAFAFDILVVGATTAPVIAGFQVKGVAALIGGTATVLSSTTEVLHKDTGALAWDVRFSGDGTSGFVLQVKDGGGVSTIRWSASMRTTMLHTGAA